jgi:hypothetical protein
MKRKPGTPGGHAAQQPQARVGEHRLREALQEFRLVLDDQYAGHHPCLRGLRAILHGTGPRCIACSRDAAFTVSTMGNGANTVRPHQPRSATMHATTHARLSA